MIVSSNGVVRRVSRTLSACLAMAISCGSLSCAYIGLPCAVQCAVAQEDNSGHVKKEKISGLES